MTNMQMFCVGLFLGCSCTFSVLKFIELIQKDIPTARDRGR